MQQTAASVPSLHEVAALFLRLGATSFGGPAVHIAMMEEEVVSRRGWLAREEFVDLLGATNLIPGPSSTEMAIHIGHRLRGMPGLLIAGACFIFPAMLIVGAFAWGYVRFGALPPVEAVLYGVKPVIIAVVVQAIWVLGRTSVKSPSLAVIGLTALFAALMGLQELGILLACGLCSMSSNRRPASSSGRMSAFLSPALASGAVAGGSVAFGSWPLFLFFLKVGSVLFGSGYVLLAFLRNDLVERFGWITERQLLDAIVIGQITPGPVFTTATFIGYLLDGISGAAIATAGIFLPAFLFVALSGPLVPRIRSSPAADAFLDGVNVASLALMTAVAVHLSRAAVVDSLTALLAVASAVLLMRVRVSSGWIVVGGAMIGACTIPFR